jgi:hypothetical protein
MRRSANLRQVRAPQALPGVRGRRAQCDSTGPQSTVPRAAPGGGGAELAPAGAAAGEGRA